MISLNKHSIHISIAERYANISYIFEFENLNENTYGAYGSKSSDELNFELTIDPDAFISGFIADIDGVLFYGETKEKKEAKQEYTTAKQKNENAILITQPHADIPNIFRIQTNIDYKSKIILTIQIEQYLKKQFNFNQLNTEIIKQFTEYNIKKQYQNVLFQIQITDKRGIFDIKLPSNNDITIDKNIMNKNKTLCTINGKIISEINEFSLKYKIFGEQDESNTLYDPKSKTFIHIINNITSNSVDNIIPRRVVFIIDKSGSMRGRKWDKTILATITTLKQLRNNYDRYGILFFDNNIDIWYMMLADKTNVLRAITYVRNQTIGGATNINKALLKGIELIKNDINLFNDSKSATCNLFQNQIIFITDGEPNRGETNVNNIISNVINENKLDDKYCNKISIFSFGVGSDNNDSSWTKDLNHSFLKLLSLNNNGIYKRIKQSKCDIQLNEYFNILSKPVLLNINIKYQDSNCINLTKTVFNSLYSGNDIIICGQLQTDKILTLTANVSAITGQQIKDNDEKFIIKPVEINKKININLMSLDDEKTENINNNNNIERIWAYLKLKQFSEKRLINNDMIEYDDDDNTLPLSLAKKYKFVTHWTSMIVVKHKDMDDVTVGTLLNTNQEEKHNYHSPKMSPLVGSLGVDCNHFQGFTFERPKKSKTSVNDLFGGDDIQPRSYHVSFSHFSQSESISASNNNNNTANTTHAQINRFKVEFGSRLSESGTTATQIENDQIQNNNNNTANTTQINRFKVEFGRPLSQSGIVATQIDNNQQQYDNNQQQYNNNQQQRLKIKGFHIIPAKPDESDECDETKDNNIYKLPNKEKEVNILIDAKIVTLLSKTNSNEMLLGFEEDMELPSINKMKCSAKEVSEWVGSLGNAYKQYMQAFVDNGINGEFMNELCYVELSEIVGKRLHCKTILSRWSKLNGISLTRIDCNVSNMVYLINKVLKSDLLGVNENAKEFREMICRYFMENKIAGREFVALVKKNEFVKNITKYMQQTKDNKEEISHKLLMRLQKIMLEIIM